MSHFGMVEARVVTLQSFSRNMALFVMQGRKQSEQSGGHVGDKAARCAFVHCVRQGTNLQVTPRHHPSRATGRRALGLHRLL